MYFGHAEADAEAGGRPIFVVDVETVDNALIQAFYVRFTVPLS